MASTEPERDKVRLPLGARTGQMGMWMIAALAPEGDLRMSANPHTNGGLLTGELDLPNIAEYAVDVLSPGERTAESTSTMAQYLRDALRGSAARRNFRVFGSDETASNRGQRRD